MVFYNCQIDVFFHMRSHYNRLRNVQSVVDCSPPKSLKRLSQSEISFQHVEMTHHPTNSYGLKRHICEYSCAPKGGTHLTKSRPKTRRHPDDSPQPKLPEKRFGPVFKAKSANPARKIKSEYSDSFPSYDTSKSSSPIETFTNQYELDKAAVQEKKRKTSPTRHAEGENAEMTRFQNEDISSFKTSVEEQEYLQFLLRITEDIIKNDLYSNDEMKKVFTNHLKANSPRLELDRMLLKIYELMKELNIPLRSETGEKDKSSWAEIVEAMKDLLCLGNGKSDQEDENGKVSVAKKCICFDMRNEFDLENDATKEGIEDVDDEEYTPMNKFDVSLDRLTERTEPISSKATFKVSTIFSNFEDVGVLPGFEGLETPHVSKGVLCEIYCEEKVPRSIQTLCHMHTTRKKLKVRKHKFKKVKKRKSGKISRKLEQGDPEKNIKMYKTENIQCEITKSKHNQEIIIITLQDTMLYKENKTDYILVEGPIFVSKKFLRENPDVIMKNHQCCPTKYVFPSTIAFNEKQNTRETSTMTEGEFEVEKRMSNNGDPQEDVKTYVSEMKMSLFQKNAGLNYFDNREGGGQLESDNLCKMNCPHKTSCNKLRVGNKNETIKKNPPIYSEEYDLTPQKENRENNLPPPIIIEDLLQPREIQTEDIPRNTTIVGVLLTSYDDPPDGEPPEDVEVSSNPSRSNENVTPKITEEKNKKDSLDMKKKASDPTNSNMLFMSTKPDGTANDPQWSNTNQLLPIPMDNSNPNLDSKTSNLQTDPDPTLSSMATVDPKNNFHSIEDEMQKKTVSPIFSLLSNLQDFSKEEYAEEKQRRVSILKNPIVQVPVEKVVPDAEGSKKMGESIIKTVEGLKDRQISRDPFLDRVLQDIESNRETRIGGRTPTLELSEWSEYLAAPGPSALKTTGRPLYYSRDEEESEQSLEEIPAKHPQTTQKGVTAIERRSIASVASEQSYLSQMDDLTDLKGTPSQIRQVHNVTAKLEQFRQTNEENEAEISSAFDRLIEQLKEQQQKEEESLLKVEEPEDQKSEPPSRRKRKICCGLCRRKRDIPVVLFIESPRTNVLSEQDYKEKSEAFEKALASLGQNETSTTFKKIGKDVPEWSGVEEKRSSENVEGSHCENNENERLSSVRIAENKEIESKTLNENGEEFLSKTSSERII